MPFHYDMLFRGRHDGDMPRCHFLDDISPLTALLPHDAADISMPHGIFSLISGARADEWALLIYQQEALQAARKSMRAHYDASMPHYARLGFERFRHDISIER